MDKTTVTTASEQISQLINGLDDWRGETLADLRTLINDCSPDLKEEWKWNAPVWSYNGKNIFSIGAFKNHVKMVFFQGAAMSDPDQLFNSGLDAKTTRSIDLNKDESVDSASLKRLIGIAIALQEKA